jgi:hypothetical protein
MHPPFFSLLRVVRSHAAAVEAKGTRIGGRRRTRERDDATRRDAAAVTARVLLLGDHQPVLHGACCIICPQRQR